MYVFVFTRSKQNFKTDCIKYPTKRILLTINAQVVLGILNIFEINDATPSQIIQDNERKLFSTSDSSQRMFLH